MATKSKLGRFLRVGLTLGMLVVQLIYLISPLQPLTMESVILVKFVYKMIHMSGTFKFEILQVKKPFQSPLAQVVKAKSPDHLYPTWVPIAIKLHCVKSPGLPNLRIILYFY